MFVYTVKDVFQTIIVGLVLLAIVVPFGGAVFVTTSKSGSRTGDDFVALRRGNAHDGV
jgi:hypothetical protein